MPRSSYFSDTGGYDDIKSIQVKKGTPATGKYAIFYMQKTDPVIFCKNWSEVVRELRKLRKMKSVRVKSVKVFKYISVG